MYYTLFHGENAILDIVAETEEEAKQQIRKLGEVFKQVGARVKINDGAVNYRMSITPEKAPKGYAIHLDIVLQ